MQDDTTILREQRGLAIAFALCGLASLTLLANHPSEHAHSFAEVLKSEAQNQFADALVHGGFMLTLGVLAVCVVILCRHLGSAKVPVVIGLVAFLAGCGALSASMLLDGLVTPALAVRFANTGIPDDVATAKTLFILLGTAIGFLMPIGILLQSIAMLSLSSVMVRSRGVRRAVGVLGVLAALVWVIALLASPAALATHVMLGGILLLTIWYLALAAALWVRERWA